MNMLVRTRGIPGTGLNLGLKAAIVAVLALVMLLPLSMVEEAARERRERAETLRSELVATAGGEVVVAGPVLAVPALVARPDGRGGVEWRRETAVALPESLSITGSADASTRSRGIYDVTVYSGVVELEATFRLDPAEAAKVLRVREADLRLDPRGASVSVELPDMRALRDTPTLASGAGAPTPMKGDSPSLGLYSRAVSAPFPMAGGTATARIRLPLGGGGSIGFLPLGGVTRAGFSSDWPSPSFSGYLLPSERELGPAGFSARWYAPDSVRPFPAWFLAGGEGQGEARRGPGEAGEAVFGVDFHDPVDYYRKVTRALKYALLFVAVPFLAFFLFETFLGARIHPVQYVLVGFADAVFYLVVLSVAEHAPFALAYWGAALATSALLALYAGVAAGNARKGRMLFPAMCAAYLYLYAALESEDYALLIGSLGLFAALAGIMAATRRVDWYALAARSGMVRSGPGLPGAVRADVDQSDADRPDACPPPPDEAY